MDSAWEGPRAIWRGSQQPSTDRWGRFRARRPREEGQQAIDVRSGLAPGGEGRRERVGLGLRSGGAPFGRGVEGKGDGACPFRRGVWRGRATGCVGAYRCGHNFIAVTWLAVRPAKWGQLLRKRRYGAAHPMLHASYMSAICHIWEPIF
jgi:hypothetical protein